MRAWKKLFFVLLASTWPLIGWASALKQIEAPIKPFAFYANGEYQGLFYELGSEVAKHVKMEHDFQIVPWERSKKYMSEGFSDIEISPLYENSASAYDVVFPAVGEMKFGLYTRKDLAQSSRKLLIAVSNLGLTHFKEIFDNDFTLATYDNFDHAIWLLKTAKVDGIVINQLAFEFLVHDLELNADDYANIWSLTLPIHITQSNKSQINKNTLEIVAQELSQQGVLNRLIDKCIPRYISDMYCEMR